MMIVQRIRVGIMARTAVTAGRDRKSQHRQLNHRCISVNSKRKSRFSTRQRGRHLEAAHSSAT